MHPIKLNPALRLMVNMADCTSLEGVAYISIDKGKITCHWSNGSSRELDKPVESIVPYINDTPVQCQHPRSERVYIGQGMLRCKLCGEEFN